MRRTLRSRRIELAVPAAGQEVAPFGGRESQYRALLVAAVAHSDIAVRLVLNFDAVAVRVAE
jgi:hypothetical protein